MRLLITGAGGLYGSKLAMLSLERGHQVYCGYNLHQADCGIPVLLDVTDKAGVEAVFSRVCPDVVVHAAALTNVDKCELDRELAWKVNVEGTINVAQAAKDHDVFMLYISTDYVFDGEKGNYVETDLPSPISYYGYTKLKAEEHVQKIAPKWCVGRTSVVYGAAPAAGKVNFALWLLNKLQSDEQVKIFVDQWNSPTLNTNLAEMTLEVAERRLTGIYHLCGASRVSRFDFASLLAKIFGLDASLLVPTTSKALLFPAKRPRDSSLNPLKATHTLKYKPLHLESALKQLKIELSSFK